MYDNHPEGLFSGYDVYTTLTNRKYYVKYVDKFTRFI